MSQAPAYVRTTSFADDERANAGGRSTVATSDVDAELDAVGTSLNQTINNLSLLQRADGVIRDGTVPISSLGADTLKLLTVYASAPRGAWLTATIYAAKDLVTQGGNTYICAQAHTSGTFATDLAAVKWLLFQIGANPNAAAMPFASTGLITSSNVQAAITEVDTNWRALASLSPMTSTRKREVQTATAGQTVFTLTMMAYTVGDKSLLVSVDGQDLPQSDYTETSSTVVTFPAPGLLAGQQVEFHAGYLSALGTGQFTTTDATASSTVSSYRFNRQVNYSGGTPGYVNACVYAETDVNNATATAYEWAGLFVMRNHATAGQNVGLYAQGNKYAGAGPTWGATIEMIDLGTGDPPASTVSVEVDMSANGTDSHLSRVMMDLVYRRQGHTGTAMEAAFGIRFNSDDTDTSKALLRTAIGFTASARVGFGIDFSPAVFSAAAMVLGQGQILQWNNTTGAAVRQQYYNGSSLVVADTTGTTYWSFNDNGTLFVKGKQLLSASGQQAGWVVMTGAQDHTTAFPVATVTTAQLASRVAAMEAVMLNQGFIQP